MQGYDLQKEFFEKIDCKDKEDVKKFLKKNNLSLDNDIEFTVVIKDEERIVGTGSFSDNILKCIAVDDEYRGFGISNMIVSELINEEFRRGVQHLFVYTKPSNQRLFVELGFSLLAKSDKVIVLENTKSGIYNYCEKLLSESLKIDGYDNKSNNISAIVMNCNPFTNGHKYLISRASKESDYVHLFILDEDKSVFSKDVRFDLVKEGIKEFKNVILHSAKEYIISSATFPSYFLKSESDLLESQATIDAEIFTKYIAKKLNITKRYVGTEPYCKVTNAYNTILKKVLSENDIELIEIKREKYGNEFISASKVREYLKENNFNMVKNLVPISTYEFLLTNEGKDIISKI